MLNDPRHSPAEQFHGVILGASKVHHFIENVEALLQGPLPAEVKTEKCNSLTSWSHSHLSQVVQVLDEACLQCKLVSASYSRGFSGSALK
jgi:hypothetical protein